MHCSKQRDLSTKKQRDKSLHTCLFNNSMHRTMGYPKLHWQINYKELRPYKTKKVPEFFQSAVLNCVQGNPQAACFRRRGASKAVTSVNGRINSRQTENSFEPS